MNPLYSSPPPSPCLLPFSPAPSPSPFYLFAPAAVDATLMLTFTFFFPFLPSSLQPLLRLPLIPSISFYFGYLLCHHPHSYLPLYSSPPSLCIFSLLPLPPLCSCRRCNSVGCGDGQSIEQGKGGEEGEEMRRGEEEEENEKDIRGGKDEKTMERLKKVGGGREYDSKRRERKNEIRGGEEMLERWRMLDIREEENRVEEMRC